MSSVETKGVITTKSNGIKHNEYLLMVPGRDKNSHPIDYLDKNKEDSDVNISDQSQPANSFKGEMPNIGDVYRKRSGNHFIDAMVVAINGGTIFLGNNLEVSLEELTDSERWEFQYSLLED